ncbi:uncharacterized protein MYCGRDRAFT_98067 [Zymoseptoria tritici IPO323]|uniref:Uncharacterized protein n=1 Tax=Zymoseptoria tritici (strain CBS 115943 / IPO323) TaxID=336722 RepID=F9XS78_ZYMTI|nr:uncharacterized protein MYCGRDRAFT_98067 [Zymoseptoria tritici IPO323]EGP81923.1 hypothetical protein MYCGRDRAFT_98067 [Zymoseptoria tritici IPO323]
MVHERVAPSSAQRKTCMKRQLSFVARDVPLTVVLTQLKLFIKSRAKALVSSAPPKTRSPPQMTDQELCSAQLLRELEESTESVAGKGEKWVVLKVKPRPGSRKLAEMPPSRSAAYSCVLERVFTGEHEIFKILGRVVEMAERSDGRNVVDSGFLFIVALWELKPIRAISPGPLEMIFLSQSLKLAVGVLLELQFLRLILLCLFEHIAIAILTVFYTFVLALGFHLAPLAFPSLLVACAP